MHNTSDSDLIYFINLRGFPACCTFLAVFAKRFGLVGRRDAIAEAGLAGSDTADSILKGKQYNRDIRIAKYVFEALHRTKLDTFKNGCKRQSKCIDECRVE